MQGKLVIVAFMVVPEATTLSSSTGVMNTAFSQMSFGGWAGVFDEVQDEWVRTESDTLNMRRLPKYNWIPYLEQACIGWLTNKSKQLKLNTTKTYDDQQHCNEV